MDTAPPQSDTSAPLPEPKRPRRAQFLGLRTGLESKLLLSVTGIFAMAVGMCCFLILQQQRNNAETMTEEQAISLSRGLAAAVPGAVERDNRAELARIARRLTGQRDVMAAAILDARGRVLASSGRIGDAPDVFAFLPPPSAQVGAFDPIYCAAPDAGNFLAVTSPVLSLMPDQVGGMPGKSPAHEGFHIAGYVTVCIAQASADAATETARLKVIFIGTLTVLTCFPLAAMLIHKLLDPIRSLVRATHQITAGDLDTQVAVDRPDVIGVLARSFNQMVLRIRRQQLALENANRELESKVLDRTAQLETANKRLSSEIAGKEDFLQAVSHDLNAPLRNIAGMADMLIRRRDSFDADVVHRLERIQKNVEVETNLIAELLELSRIKKQRLKMDDVDIRSLVEEVAGTFEADLRTREIRFVIDGPLPRLRCERSRLRQVFQNLIDNAVKYMGQRPGTPREIHVGCVLRGAEAEFYVRDTGLGMDSGDLDVVFRMFRRGHNARAAGIPGKGIGLASVKNIVETYSGSIWAESTPGAGSTFRFTINGEFVLNASAAHAA